MVSTSIPLGDPKPSRAGEYVPQGSGYRAFIPKALPPDPPLELYGELLGLLSAADIAIGRLDGIAQNVPEPDLFVAMYVKQEAVLSSQIEGTQSTQPYLDLFVDRPEISPSGPHSATMA